MNSHTFSTHIPTVVFPHAWQGVPSQARKDAAKEDLNHIEEKVMPSLNALTNPAEKMQKLRIIKRAQNRLKGMQSYTPVALGP